MKYVHSEDGITVDSFLSLINHSGERGWYPVTWNPAPKVGEFAVAVGFHRNGDGFSAEFEYHKIPEPSGEATEADKDAALRSFGVEV